MPAKRAGRNCDDGVRRLRSSYGTDDESDAQSEIDYVESGRDKVFREACFSLLRAASRGSLGEARKPFQMSVREWNSLVSHFHQFQNQNDDGGSDVNGRRPEKNPRQHSDDEQRRYGDREKRRDGDREQRRDGDDPNADPQRFLPQRIDSVQLWHTVAEKIVGGKTPEAEKLGHSISSFWIVCKSVASLYSFLPTRQAVWTSFRRFCYLAMNNMLLFLLSIGVMYVILSHFSVGLIQALQWLALFILAHLKNLALRFGSACEESEKLIGTPQ